MTTGQKYPGAYARYTNKKRYFVLLFAYIALTYLVLLFDREVISFFCREDGFFENLGALAYFVTAILFVVAFVLSGKAENRATHSTIRRLMYLLLALLFLFCAGEEISWGQRMLHIETPEQLQEMNMQGEINVHNLKVFQLGSAHNASRWMFLFFWLMFTFGVPVAATIYEPLRRLFNWFMPVVPWRFGVVFLTNYLIWRFVHMLTYYDPLLPYAVNFPDEIMESNIAVLFVVVSIYIIQELDARTYRQNVQGLLN